MVAGAESEAPIAPPSTSNRGAPKTSVRCRERRAAADSAHAAGRWKQVLAVTHKRACWPSGHAARRRVLRVKAHLELDQYDACVAEATRASEPTVIKMLAFCKRKTSP